MGGQVPKAQPSGPFIVAHWEFGPFIKRRRVDDLLPFAVGACGQVACFTLIPPTLQTGAANLEERWLLARTLRYSLVQSQRASVKVLAISCHQGRLTILALQATQPLAASSSREGQAM
jgi:hypothetical protein